ncbi:MAG: amidohydrolase family protein [Candidatus Hodarchaeota archaeon]
MSKLIIKNGIVFDPFNSIEGETKDILIEEGKVVEKFSNETNVKEIDANNKTVIPSAIDIHSHIASQQLAWIRLLGTKNVKFQQIWKGLTYENIAKTYISSGFTFVVEANVFPSLIKQTIFDLKQIPVLDKAILLNLSNYWPLELEFQRGMEEEATIFLSDLLDKTKGFGFKVYNPFEAENWNYQKIRENLSQKGRLYNFNPIDIYEKFIRYNERLRLPHSIHAHIEGYENIEGKENLNMVLEKIQSLELSSLPLNGSKFDRSQIFHLAHASSYNVDGDNNNIVSLLNGNEKLDLDLGFCGFNEINPLITNDRRLIHSIQNNGNNYKLIRSAVEFEGDTFATFRTFNKKNKAHCNMWANALDLSLNIKNIWQLQFSLNFPNYAMVNDIPEIITWLISKEARENFMKELNQESLKNHNLKNTNKELNFNDIVILTRSSPAKSLGIGYYKGNLGNGSDGDLNILNINVNNINLSKDYQKLASSLRSIEFVIKEGEIIKKRDNYDLKNYGKLFWSKGRTKIERKPSILNKKEDFFQKYYSIFYNTMKYELPINFLREIK